MPAKNTPHTDDGSTESDDGRYGTFRTGDDELVIYERRDRNRWIASTLTVPVEP